MTVTVTVCVSQQSLLGHLDYSIYTYTSAITIDYWKRRKFCCMDNVAEPALTQTNHRTANPVWLHIQYLFKLNYKNHSWLYTFSKTWLKQKENVNKTKCWQKHRTKGAVTHCRWGGDPEQALWRSLAVTYAVKHFWAHYSVMPGTSLYSREMKT